MGKIKRLFAGVFFRLHVAAMLFRLPAWLINHIFAAQILGWNELAKMQVELSQRAICRAMKRATTEAAKSIGIKTLPSYYGNPVVLEIEMPGHAIPPLEFRESDWELMRAALAEHDRTAVECVQQGGAQ
jgi:hypothetical protein